MPFGDRTGSRGEGPMTGRGAGHCAGYAVPGAMNPFYGRGGVWGRGGHGYRHWYYATGLPGWARAGYGPAAGEQPVGEPSAASAQTQQMALLEQQAARLREQLEALEEQIAAAKGVGSGGEPQNG